MLVDDAFFKKSWKKNLRKPCLKPPPKYSTMTFILGFVELLRFQVRFGYSFPFFFNGTHGSSALPASPALLLAVHLIGPNNSMHTGADSVSMLKVSSNDEWKMVSGIMTKQGYWHIYPKQNSTEKLLQRHYGPRKSPGRRSKRRDLMDCEPRCLAHWMPSINWVFALHPLL